MNSPLLDPRGKDDLMRLVTERAREYTPEWRCERDESDPGYAIARLFGDMFHETVDRFNQLPHKYYTEFLNLLGVESPSVTPAYGYMQFENAGGEPVRVNADTEVYAPVDEENIIYSTERAIDVTSARLTSVYYADAHGGHIEKLDMDREQLFFAPAGNENLQRCRFSVCNNEVLSLSGECAVHLSLRQSASYMEDATAKMLADPGFARWSYFNGEREVPFDEVSAEAGVLSLVKRNADRLCPDEEGRICVHCDILPGAQGSVVLRGVGLKSSRPAPVPADALANNDIPIEPDEGGYCFGRRPAMYELFYIRCDDVFQKRGARVSVRFDVRPVIVPEAEDAPRYEFNKRIIDKQDAVRVVPDEVFVQQVVWEYYNGTGWARLDAWGDVNPFSCKDGHELNMVFTVPGDAEENTVNAESGWHIRARVVNVENYFSQTPKWILPFVKGVDCAYRYDDFIDADYVRAVGSAKTTEIDNARGLTDLALTAFRAMEPHPRAMYLCFDSSPHAMPLSMLFEIWGDALLQSKIVYEAYTDRFELLRVIDGTKNLRYTGTSFLYLPQPLSETEFFGERGYWIRMSLSSAFGEVAAPCVKSVRLNVVTASQLQRAAEQVFSAGSYDASKRLELLEKPVLNCEVWVDERNALSQEEMAALRDDSPERVREESADGTERFYVRWERVPSLAFARPLERVYELDGYEGVITFGRGDNGRVPPRGEDGIRVSYTFGGGAAGNLPAGRVNALVGSIARISEVRNITAMSGGVDRPAPDSIEALGNKRLRHRFRAVAAGDFEQITRERFPRVMHVKCFPNTDAAGAYSPGHVCVVVTGRELFDERMTVDLCREIYAYLCQRCDCNLIARDMLHVVPSTEITVSVYAAVLMRDIDQAAVTQQRIGESLSALIENVWRGREIGEQLRINELYQAVKAVPNVSAITRILPEGSYFREGRRFLVALDDNAVFPFATVKNGTHTVRIG